MSEIFRYKVNMYRLREERSIEPQTLANLVSSTLYERRFGPYFVSPVIAGINQRTGDPFICGFDSIGCIDFAKDFIVSGTASDQLFGTCEALWEEGLGEEDLFETCSQALLNAVDRDALSGWGAMVYVITKDKITKRLLKGTSGSSCKVDVMLTLWVDRTTGLEEWNKDRTTGGHRAWESALCCYTNWNTTFSDVLKNCPLFVIACGLPTIMRLREQFNL